MVRGPRSGATIQVVTDVIIRKYFWRGPVRLNALACARRTVILADGRHLHRLRLLVVIIVIEGLLLKRRVERERGP